MDRPLRLIRAPIAVLVLLISLLLGGCGDASGAAQVTVGAAPAGPAVPPGFLGVSMEYKSVEAYTGDNPGALDAPFVQLLRNLSPAGGFVLRVGGDSTDWSWWPMPRTVPPGGVRFDLGPNWSAVARSLARALSGRLILGIQFEADNRNVAAYEAAQLVSHIGSSLIDALELGNEPELYASFPWYKTASGRHVYGRTRSYSPSTLIGDWGNIAAALPRGVTVAGPSAGSVRYLDALGSFVSHEPRLGLVTVHAYPLKHCDPHVFAGASDFFTYASLQGLANMIGGWVDTSRAHRLPLRVDEMNSISCGGQKGLSQAFAPALWALDMLPRILRAGATGVNFHTVPNTNQALIGAAESHGRWRVSVEPEYYGLLAFAQAAPAGSRLLRVSSSPALADLDEWATRAPSGQIHVVFVNSGTARRTVTLSVAGAAGPATVERLRAPSLTATSGVSLAGQQIAATSGALAGTPVTASLTPSSGRYAVTVPAHSGAILTLNAG